MVNIKSTEIFRPITLLTDILSQADIPYTETPGFVAANREAFEQLGAAALKEAGWDYRGRIFITLEKDGDDEDVVIFEDRTITKALDEEIERRKQEIINAESLRGRRGRNPDSNIDTAESPEHNTLVEDAGTDDSRRFTPPPSTCPDCDSLSGLATDDEGIRCDICGWGPDLYGKVDDAEEER